MRTCMSKQEFVDRLRSSLSGKLSPALVEENARYYEEYINTQIRLGEQEEKVLEALGDPRLIARSIVAAEGGRSSASAGDYREYDGGREQEADGGRKIRPSFHITRLPSWALPVLAVGTMLLAFVIIGLVFHLLLQVIAWLWPVVFIALIVVFFVKLFRDWLH